MGSRAEREVASAAAVVFGLASTLHFFGNNVADPDLWQRLNCGREILAQGRVPGVDSFSYTARGLPFVNHEWLADVWTTLLVEFLGPGALVVFKILIGVATALLAVDSARRLLREHDEGAGVDPAGSLEPLLAAGGLALGLAVISPGATYRPQLWTILFLAVEANLLGRVDQKLGALGKPVGSGRSTSGRDPLTPSANSERAALRPLWLLPPLLAAWANLHGGFVVGLALALVYLGVLAARATFGGAVWTAIPVLRGAPESESWSPRGEREALRRSWPLLAALGLACLAAPLVNPWGVGLYEFLGRTLQLHDEISEWKPIDLLGDHFLRFKLLVALGLASLALLTRWRAFVADPASSTDGGVRGRPGRLRLVDWRGIFAAAAIVASFRHQRHSVLFGVFATPIVLVGLELGRRAAIARFPALSLQGVARAAVMCGVVLVSTIQLGGVLGMFARDGLTIRYGRMDFPRDAIDFLRANGFRGNVAMPFEWGSYATWHLPEDSRVFIDGRFETVYPEAVVEDYFAFQDGREGWARILDAYPTEIVVVQRWREIHPRLFARPDLVYVYSDPAALVFVKPGPTNDGALARLERSGADRLAFARQPTIFP